MLILVAGSSSLVWSKATAVFRFNILNSPTWRIVSWTGNFSAPAS